MRSILTIAALTVLGVAPACTLTRSASGWPDTPPASSRLVRDRWPAGVDVWIAGEVRWLGGDASRIVHLFGPDGERAEGEVHVWAWGSRVRIADYWFEDGFAIRLPEGPIEHALTFRAYERDEASSDALRLVREEVLNIRTRVGGAIEDILTAKQDQAVEDALRRDVRAEVAVWDIGAPNARIQVTLKGLNWLARPMDNARIDTLALIVDVLRDGEVVATTQAWWPARNLWRNRLLMTPVGEGLSTPSDGQSRWLVRVRPNPALALRNFQGRTYWDGAADLVPASVHEIPPPSDQPPRAQRPRRAALPGPAAQ